MRKLLILAALFSSAAFASDQPPVIACNMQQKIPFSGLSGVFDCSMPGTPQTVSYLAINGYGQQVVANAPGRHVIYCNANDMCSKGPAREFAGQAPMGNYLVTRGYYIGVTEDGQIVAFIPQGESQ